MAYRSNVRVVLKATLKKIIKSSISLILYIELTSLYNYFVKLGIIPEKCLIVVIMNLR